MKYVVAGNHSQYENWCYENKVSIFSTSHCYVSGCHILKSIINSDVVYYGTYHKQSDYFKIKDLLSQRGYKESTSNNSLKEGKNGAETL